MSFLTLFEMNLRMIFTVRDNCYRVPFTFVNTLFSGDPFAYGKGVQHSEEIVLFS